MSVEAWIITGRDGQPRVLLDLGTAEAQFLYDLGQCVSGFPERSRRGYVERISRALETVGIDRDNNPLRPDPHERCVDFDEAHSLIHIGPLPSGERLQP